MNVYDEFRWRGMVYDATEGLAELFATQSLTFMAVTGQAIAVKWQDSAGTPNDLVTAIIERLA